ncbi:bifunctional nicotinamidase/pyrazinamidase [Vibrio fluvialis]|uniref:bifunctional nicotinamidase/pyrazinamidase n=1 Tax=Vibrio fluvialis TaxID=676 RepID=UPI001F2C61BF|nr:bifunctional nicotinamidase/pyrazinamidase [Vibrio fluvialis]EKO3374279.1 bifunctional nicotinamidase/pyrazinamidase [Vibrio fluvialis]ELE5026603.1 bifunctional nicotinamidase/pyrazinamidase [Vibrio fluvialis]MCE7609111.1 bifunctional nicotinamidase/pyrazinamidase [Vibrio fluvialis]MCE7620511.1 bifunctional nicotinamidase/pyrazinamidase [Vibrio fluvialis]MCE7629277.1 bifunctional nicotinamidase/pyrazinamidase [Vibrio fluvialis]
MSKTLILVDVQNDFAPGGALAVPEGDVIVPVINRLLPHFEHVIATKDWHPAGHASFASVQGKSIGEVVVLKGVSQIMWPDHCVQKTPGAEFIPGLNTDAIDYVVYKGTNPDIDSYSGFFDNQRLQSTGLEDYLKDKGIREVYIVGLATDYCVKFTALDAASLGFQTSVIEDACRGVNMSPQDSEQALVAMKAAGCHVITSTEFLAHC